jgi:hypothetical protein
MGCRTSKPVFPHIPSPKGGEDVASIIASTITTLSTPLTDIDSEYIYAKNIKYNNKEFKDDTILYEEPVISSFIDIENIRYINELRETKITDTSVNYIDEKAEQILHQYKKLIKFILKNEKINNEIFNYEKMLFHDWWNISNNVIDNKEDYHKKFIQYNIKYNLLLNKLNPLLRSNDNQKYIIDN